MALETELKERLDTLVDLLAEKLNWLLIEKEKQDNKKGYLNSTNADYYPNIPAVNQGLSEVLTNAKNYTNDEINLIIAALEDKVDKISGKGLSTNDFTTELKTKLEEMVSSKFRGSYPNLADLKAEYPEGSGQTWHNNEGGWYADVGGIGEDDVRFTWDKTDLKWVQSGIAGLTKEQVKQLYLANSDTNNFDDAAKDKLDGIQAGAQKNVVPDWNAGPTSEKRIDNKPTKLSDFQNDKNYVSKEYVDDEFDKKVDKETGKGLSTNDFTTELKNKLDTIEEGANKITSNSQIANDEGYLKESDYIDTTYTASNGAKLVGNDIQADVDDETIEVSGGKLKVKQGGLNKQNLQSTTDEGNITNNDIILGSRNITSAVEISRDHVNGCYIKTDLIKGQMFMLRITGNSYSTSELPINILLQGYVNNIGYSRANTGYTTSTIDKIILIDDGSTLNFWIEPLEHYQALTFELYSYSTGGIPVNAKITEIVDVVEPTIYSDRYVYNLKTLATQEWADGKFLTELRPISDSITLDNSNTSASSKAVHDLNQEMQNKGYYNDDTEFPDWAAQLEDGLNF